MADKIKSFLHFSVPDEGPLTDYESWMPDFMDGLAKGIEKSKKVVAKAVEGVSQDMVISPVASLNSTEFTADRTSRASNSDSNSVAGPLIEIKEMTVRNDDDIKKISQQLYRQLQQGRRANGFT